MNNNVDLQSILNSAKSQLSSISVGSTGSVSSNKYVNSVWNIAQEGQAALDGNDQQKAEAAVNIVKKLLSMFSSIGAKENAQATQDVKENDNKASELTNNAENTAQSIEEQVNELMSQIEEGSNTVSDAIEKLKELGGDEGQLAEAQKKLDEQIEIIEENKQILNDESANPETKKTALANLLTASGAIDALVTNVISIQSAIEEQNTTVEEATNNISGFVEQTAGVISSGIEMLQKYIGQGTTQTTKNTLTAATGATNITVGTTAETMGSTASAFPILGSSIGTKLLQIGSDQIGAGNTRIAGSTKTLASLSAGLGKMGANIQNIASFTNSVGEIADKVISLVGEYGTETESLITATGSWSDVSDVNEEFKTAINQYQATNGLTATKQSGSTEKTDKKDETSSTATHSVNTENTTSNINDNSTKFEFDPQKFKTAFGI